MRSGLGEPWFRPNCLRITYLQPHKPETQQNRLDIECLFHPYLEVTWYFLKWRTPRCGCFVLSSTFSIFPGLRLLFDT